MTVFGWSGWAALGSLITALAAIGALVFTSQSLRATQKQIEISEQGQLTERFGKAVEQLGSEKLELRLGRIYALERLARDSARDHPTVMQVLAAFVRSHTPAPHAHPSPRSRRSQPSTYRPPSLLSDATPYTPNSRTGSTSGRPASSTGTSPTPTSPAPTSPTPSSPAPTSPASTSPAPTSPTPTSTSTAPTSPTLTSPALTSPAPTSPALTSPALTSPALISLRRPHRGHRASRSPFRKINVRSRPLTPKGAHCWDRPQRCSNRCNVQYHAPGPRGLRQP